MSHLQFALFFGVFFFLFVRLLSWNGCKDDTLGFKTLKQTNSTRVTLPSHNKFKIAENSRVAEKLAHHDEYSPKNKYAREREQYVSWRLLAPTCEGLIAKLTWLCQTLHRNRAAGPPTHTRLGLEYNPPFVHVGAVGAGFGRAQRRTNTFRRLLFGLLCNCPRDERLVCECRTNHHLPFPTRAFCDWESFKYSKLILETEMPFPSNSHTIEWPIQDRLLQFHCPYRVACYYRELVYEYD